MPLRANKKGFSTTMLLLLAFVMFLIAGSYAVHIQSENDQAVNTARSSVAGARLNFISQTIQADFYNNWLQNKFEAVLAQFILSKEHQIDPQQEFMSSNMKSELENYFSTASQSIVTGEAAQVYAKAYSTIPKISCEPKELQGASSGVTLTAENKTLIANALSLGQQIYCRDTEEESDSLIALRAKDYQLKSRVIQMYDKARSATSQAVALLEWTTATKQWGGNTWRLREDAQSKTGVWEDWAGTLMALVIPVPETEGIKADGVHATAEQTDLVSACYGDVKAAFNAGTPAQTCRPEGMSMYIGNKTNPSDTDIKLEFKPTTGSSNLAITVEYMGVAINFNSKLLGDLLGKLIQQMYTQGLKTGYVGYSSSTQLCNSFKGRTTQAVISGSIIETNADYTPSGFGNLTLAFTTTSQSLDTSDITNDATCEGKKNVLETNVFDLLTMSGTTKFEFNITNSTGQPQVNAADMKRIAQTIANNPMYATTGEGKNVTLVASVNGSAAVTGTAMPPTGTGPNSALPPLTGGPGGSGTVKGLQTVIDARTGIYEPLLEVRNILQNAVSELTSLDRVEDAEAVAATATVVCKFMGMSNHMEMDDTYKALLALCSIAKLSKDERANTICNLAGLYQAVKSGSAQAAIAAIMAMLNNANYMDVMVTINQIEAAMKSGNVVDVLNAASSALRLAGKADAANFLAGAGQLIYGVEHGDAQVVLRGILSMLGEGNKLSYIYNSLLGLQEAIKSGDAMAVLHSAGQLAQGFGFSGLAQAESIITHGQALIDMVTNFDEVLASCKGKIPWDLICITPQVGGGVCEDKWGTCTFSFGSPNLMDKEKLCNDLVFDLGFQIDCTCVYTCPNFPYTAFYTKSVGVNLTAIAMLLNPEQYAGLFQNMNLQNALATGGLMNFCRLDP